MEKFVLTSEELRDLCWYAQKGCNEMLRTLKTHYARDIEEEAKRIFLLAGEIKKFDYRQIDEYYKIEGLRV